MSDKPSPVFAPMTTFTPDSTALAHARPLAHEVKPSSIHVTNCKCVFAGHASTPDLRCVALHDAQTLNKARPALVAALKEDLESEFPIMQSALVKNDGSVVGTTEELAERWRKLLHAESVFQQTCSELGEAIDDAIMAAGERMKNAEGLLEIPMAFIEGAKVTRDAVEAKIAEQKNRPSPDFRMLMVKAHAKLVEVARVVIPNGGELNETKEYVRTVRAPLKEAMRLTDVERLHPWSGSAQGRAVLYAVNALVEELNDIASGAATDDDLLEDQFWIEQTKLDLEEARDKPEEYLARVIVARRSRS